MLEFLGDHIINKGKLLLSKIQAILIILLFSLVFLYNFTDKLITNYNKTKSKY